MLVEEAGGSIHAGPCSVRRWALEVRCEQHWTLPDGARGISTHLAPSAPPEACECCCVHMSM